MKLRDLLPIIGVCLAVQGVVTVATLAFLRPSAAPTEPPPPPKPLPKTLPDDWRGREDSDRVPVQIITMADGQAWFVVGTDTAAWPPIVWLFDPVTGKWGRQ